ncbi:unnamed protein product [Rotaria magnacalcarata]|uniref:C2H2-type domain-containing protein n=1 Tax=Rotaria magnacalcarata TaxID=392030 RepID=A0A819V9N5_9BILA|nr:unnamed protein product [Rotaria magnacalcarata]CAF2211853.1 unnamed protein product [Rotaria magnacalcarata]CAF3973110.1 unnamed protein product [Rotaria magnacalcarata]CAF4105554.1 unnamed protein product [Rotaria magnacalcarata]
MSAQIYQCKFCNNNRSFQEFRDYFRHITLYHAGERNFRLTCDISSSCGITYKTFASYKMHVHRRHYSLLNSSSNQQQVNDVQDSDPLSAHTNSSTVIDPTTTNDSNADVIYVDDDNDTDDFGEPWVDLPINNTPQDKPIDLLKIQQQYTRFLLELREYHILPQSIIQSITTHILSLLDNIMELLEDQAKKSDQSSARTKSISINDMTSIVKTIKQSITISTRNEYQFLESCKNFFNYSPPIENILSLNEKKKEYSYYISIKESLRKILEKEDIMELLVENIRNQYGLTNADADLMFSCRDGIGGRKIRKNSFMIQLYVDGIGVTNPIGPKKDKHKLTIVYFMLEDIPDVFRSMLQCINLAAICHTRYLSCEEKLKQFYDPIVKDLNDLQHNGLSINTFNSQLSFSFSTVAADNLAVHEIAGFQQNFSSGYFCRRCLVTYENRLIPLIDVHFIQRTSELHNTHLQLIKNQPQIKSCCGVVGPSPLDHLLNFDPTNSFPGDVMHDFLEGTCPMLVMAMLKEAARIRLITFHGIETRTAQFIYGEFDKSNKPPPVLVKNLNNDRINGSASQKYCLFRLFPIIFSDLVEHLSSFKIYLVLRELLDMVLAYPLRKSWLPFMETLSINFQSMILEYLPDKATPKVHFASEYAKIVEQFGPPVRYWCMRYEGAHLYFKRIALRSGNFKNIPKTLAQRQQLRQCLLLSQDHFLKRYEQASGVKRIKMNEIESKIKSLFIKKFEQSINQFDESLLQCSQLIQNHIIYKQNAVYVYDLEHAEEIPKFIQLVYILKLNEQWIFIVNFLNTDGFVSKLWSYQVSSHDCFGIILPNDLKYFHKGLDLYQVNNLHFVNLSSRLTKAN